MSGDSNIHFEYCANNPLFAQHFPNNPIVPAALLIGDFFKISSTKLFSWSFRFIKPAIPGDIYTWKKAKIGYLLTSKNGIVHAVAKESLKPFVSEEWILSGSKLKSRVRRASNFNFYTYYERSGNQAQAAIKDLQSLALAVDSKRFNRSIFIAIECAGNLALELCYKNKEYQFFQFDDLYLSNREPTALRIYTKLSSDGALLKWNFSALDEQGLIFISCSQSISVPLKGGRN